MAFDGGPADAGLDGGMSRADAGAPRPSPGTLQLMSRAEARASEGDPASLAEAAKLWEEAAAGLPDPSQALLPAARARRQRAQRADAVADEVPVDAEACAADAWRGMVALDPETGKAPPSEAIGRVGPAAAELLYLRAVCNGILLRARGFTQLVEGRREIIPALERVAQLAPDLDDAGAERELGRLYAALPSASGGDLLEARRHMEAAVLRAPRSVRNRIAYATSVAVKAQDRPLFEAQLHAALEAQPDDAEAKELLSREDELFGPAEAAQPIPGGPAH
jgi:tetratricopeptide (TPR) repeat protein